MVYQTNVT